MSLYAGFDVGGTKCAAILGECSADSVKVIAKRKFPTADYRQPEACIRHFCEELEVLIAENGGTKPVACGISCGGPLDSKSGVVLSPPNLPGWDRIPVVKLVQDHFRFPAALCNDADACALAEWKFGAGRGSENMIFLTFGTGLGSGLILNGKLYSGSCGMAGECGHFRLAPEGPTGYGKAGSFEGFCSGGGIAQLGKRYALEHLPLPWCRSAAEAENLTAKIIGIAAESGDPDAQEIYRESGRRLGQGLALLIDLLNPQKIVIGSIFQRSEALLRPAMEEVLKREVLKQNLACCKVVPAELGESIGDVASLSVAAMIDLPTY